MTPLREEAELPTEATPVVKPRLFSVIALSVALGAILALFLVYFYFGSQRMATLQNEVSLALYRLALSGHGFATQAAFRMA